MSGVFSLHKVRVEVVDLFTVLNVLNHKVEFFGRHLSPHWGRLAHVVESVLD